ncbi:MAG: replication-relaxation family protein [Acidimicrobiales bacterium]
MSTNFLSPAVSSRPSPGPAPLGSSWLSIAFGRPDGLSPTDRQLLGLLGEHQVLTTSQLVRLTDLPERTVQYRLGQLDRAGLVNRHRPQVPVGTAPYHCWLTTFGAAAIGAGPPEPWGEDLAGLRAIAALSELWLGARDLGPEAGLQLKSWRRLPSGVPWRDSRTGTVRALPVEAELRVTVGGALVSALVLARVERVPSARLVAVLGRFVSAVGALPATPSPPVLLVQVRTGHLADVVRSACHEVAAAPVARHLDPAALEVAIRRVAVGVVEPRPSGLVAEAVWQPGAGGRAGRLVKVLAVAAGSGQ